MLITGNCELYDAGMNNIDTISNLICSSTDSDTEKENITDIYNNEWIYEVIQDNNYYDNEGACDDKDSGEEANEFR